MLDIYSLWGPITHFENKSRFKVASSLNKSVAQRWEQWWVLLMRAFSWVSLKSKSEILTKVLSRKIITVTLMMVLVSSTLSKEELRRYIDFVKHFNLSISFTSEVSTTSVNFLDIKITLRENSLHPSVYHKPTDSHSYLTYNSSHPMSCKKSIPYSQINALPASTLPRRFRLSVWLCTNERFFSPHVGTRWTLWWLLGVGSLSQVE